MFIENVDQVVDKGTAEAAVATEENRNVKGNKLDQNRRVVNKE